MDNPYRDLPDNAFWRRSVAGREALDVDLVGDVPFHISRTDYVATSGSCFAQHVSRSIQSKGFRYLVTEPGEKAQNYGVYPARFGNVYSTRQLLQLFERAYGLFLPVDVAWRRPDGRLADPFRPQIEPDGFPDIDALLVDRHKHLAAVKRMFEKLDVFVFTLGLTETWASSVDGAAFPLAPGVVATPEGNKSYEFVNLPVGEMEADLRETIDKLRVVNPAARVILTVSPVPLIATYERRHVLVSTMVSKSALRVVADSISRTMPNVAYFPSYEMITGHHTGYKFFEEDLREVRPEGVDYVMRSFGRHFLSDTGDGAASPRRGVQPARVLGDPAAEPDYVVCEEEELDR